MTQNLYMSQADTFGTKRILFDAVLTAETEAQESVASNASARDIVDGDAWVLVAKVFNSR